MAQLNSQCNLCYENFKTKVWEQSMQTHQNRLQILQLTRLLTDGRATAEKSKPIMRVKIPEAVAEPTVTLLT